MKKEKNKEYYLCIKTYKMEDGDIAFKKGVVYLRNESGLFTSDIKINNNPFSDHYLTKKSIKKHLLKIKKFRVELF